MCICGKLEVVKAAGKPRHGGNQASLTTDHTLIRYDERVSWGGSGLQSILQMHSSCRQAKAAFFLSFHYHNKAMLLEIYYFMLHISYSCNVKCVIFYT